MIYCGIDGGGTNTRVIVRDDNKIIVDILKRPSSIDVISIENN